MGHRSFLGKRIRPQVLKPSENYDRSPHPNARNYAVEMAPVNGNVQLSESQNELARKKREEFTNEVSRRMGDLLLRSWTMLDCYCTQCNGILMEKGETRECIQCTVFAELQQVEPGSARTTAEIEDRVQKEDETFDQLRPKPTKVTVFPYIIQVSFLRISPKKATSEVQDLKSVTANACSFAAEARANSDNLPDPRNSQPHSESSAQAAHIHNASQLFTDRIYYQPTYSGGPHLRIVDPNSTLSENVVPRSQPSQNQPSLSGKPMSSGEVMSLSALDRKLMWAAKSLDETDDIGRSIELTKLISEALACIKQFRR